MIETAYIKCVFCRMNKQFRSKRYPTGTFEVPPFEGPPGDVAFIMFMEQRAGPGRGRREKVGGWAKTRELNLGEALADPEFQGLAEDFKRKLVSLMRDYIVRGVITPEELSVSL